AVFWATRRSPASFTIADTSLGEGARSRSRSVLSTGNRRAFASRARAGVKAEIGSSVASVIAGLLQETERGDRHAGLPFFEPIEPAGSTGCRRTSYDPPFTGPLPHSSDVPRRTRGLWFWYETRVCRRSWQRACDPCRRLHCGRHAIWCRVGGQ